MIPVKRFLAFALLACLLLSGFEAADPTIAPTTEPTQALTQPATEPTTESLPETQAPTETPTEPATEAATEPATEPTQTQKEKVTVYLLEKTVTYDNGSTEYYYDEDYNIASYKVFTIENEIMYTAYFEEQNANGMACVLRTEWPDGIGNEPRNLTYFEDGKLKEEQIAGSNYTGYQYEYDQKGDMTEKREYYDGILESIVYYSYDGETLSAVYCEDKEGNKVFECRIENGLVTEKVFFDTGSEYGYSYEYDENNNLVKTTFSYDGEIYPSEQYYYKAVEVDADRAWYLLAQQNYLLPIG